MKIRFQADADFNQNIVRAVRRRQPAVDFQTADEGGLRGIEDPEVPAAAAREARIPVTQDRREIRNKIQQQATLSPNSLGNQSD